MGSISALAVGSKYRTYKKASKKEKLSEGYIPLNYDECVEIAQLRNEEGKKRNKSQFYLNALKRQGV